MSSEDYARKQALYRAPEQEAWQLFARAPCVQFAVQQGERPLLRTLSAVVVDQRLCFHGADVGEKLALRNARAVASYVDFAVQIASCWIHPELACPASTYYLSALAEGAIVPVEEPARRAQVMRALMERFQPEGNYLPIAQDEPRYRKVLEQLFIAELVPERVGVKQKLGQARSKAQIERVLEGLWRRGGEHDTRAIRLIREAHPERPAPAFLRGPEGEELCVAPDQEDATQVVALLEGQYWTTEFTPLRMARAQLGSDVWVVARDPQTRAIIASARAISDGARFAYLLDVIVAPARRGRGLGRALVRLLLDHPRVRHVACVRLRTRDAHAVYTPLGFAPSPLDPRDMVLSRVEKTA